MNTPLRPSGSMLATSPLHEENIVISLNTLHDCFNVVISQLARWRLLPTAQAMKAACDTVGGGKTTEVSPVQFLNALEPNVVTAFGSEREARLTQLSKALVPTLVKFLERVREPSWLQP